MGSKIDFNDRIQSTRYEDIEKVYDLETLSVIDCELSQRVFDKINIIASKHMNSWANKLSEDFDVIDVFNNITYCSIHIHEQGLYSNSIYKPKQSKVFFGVETIADIKTKIKHKRVYGGFDDEFLLDEAFEASE